MLARFKTFCKQKLDAYGRLGAVVLVVCHVTKNVGIAYPLYWIALRGRRPDLFGLAVVVHQGPWDILAAVGILAIITIRRKKTGGLNPPVISQLE